MGRTKREPKIFTRKPLEISPLRRPRKRSKDIQMNIKKRWMEMSSDRVHCAGACTRILRYTSTRASAHALSQYYIYVLLNTYFCTSIYAVLEGAVLDLNQNFECFPLLLKQISKFFMMSDTYKWFRTANYRHSLRTSEMPDCGRKGPVFSVETVDIYHGNVCQTLTKHLSCCFNRHKMDITEKDLIGVSKSKTIGD
jgi:hypothetical protein